MEALLRLLGKPICLLDAQGQPLRETWGIVQPLGLSDLALYGIATPGGRVQGEKYRLIAGMDAFGGEGLEKGVLWEGRHFSLLRAEKMEAEEASHWEAVLCPEGRRLL